MFLPVINRFKFGSHSSERNIFTVFYISFVCVPDVVYVDILDYIAPAYKGKKATKKARKAKWWRGHVIHPSKADCASI